MGGIEKLDGVKWKGRVYSFSFPFSLVCHYSGLDSAGKRDVFISRG